MRTPTIRLNSLLVVFGWILVIGGIVEAIDILHYGWVDTWWHEHTWLHALLIGPAVHLGLGFALWKLARR